MHNARGKKHTLQQCFLKRILGDKVEEPLSLLWVLFSVY